MLTIKGLQKTSLIDYPGKICSIVFLSQCNFRCGFCHNRDLVLNPDSLPDIPEEEAISDIKKNRLIDGVCITGGEPTMQKELPQFIKKLRDMKLLVKLDTNGTNPVMLKQLIDEKMIDFVAMDIKSTLEKYSSVTNVKVDTDLIQKSIDIIRNSGIGYEFRTTVVPGLFDENDAKQIGEWLKGSRKYSLQQFTVPGDLIDNKFKDIEAYTPEKLEEFAEILKPYFDVVEIRGI